MKKIWYGLILLAMLTCLPASATAAVSVGINIGINVPVYPELVPVPGYPVYYAPTLPANYFFYDGMYWVFLDGNWYASTWYDGPWTLVDPLEVPVYILRIPVSYYREPPVYFRDWRRDAPPRWGEHWGRGWERHRKGWDHWRRSAAPRPAPLPVYQRQYTGDRYPRDVRQRGALIKQQYHYQPRDKVVRQHFRQVESRAGAPARQQGPHQPAQVVPGSRPPHERPAPPSARHEQRQQPPAALGRAPHEQRVPREQRAPHEQRGATQDQRAPAHEQRGPTHEQRGPAREQRGPAQQHGPQGHEGGGQERGGGPEQERGHGR